jgi:S-formylglutathione hydrolase FrmB
VAAESVPDPVEVLVVTPPSYDRDASRRYPVLYFLHDGFGDGRTLERRGVAADARAAMQSRELPEFLIVAPDAPGSWFSDYHDGSRHYERFLAVDLPRWVEAHYRTLPGKDNRGVTGISMGGYGAVKLALKHPELFGSVSALSGALIPFGPDDLERYSFVARYTLQRVFGKASGDNSLEANDVWQIAWSRTFAEPPFRVELRAGTEDFYGLDGVAAQFGSVLNQCGIPTTVVLEPGNHDWAYWRKAMKDILEWHGSRFVFAYDAASR